MEKSLRLGVVRSIRQYTRRCAVLCPECGARLCDISSGSRMVQYGMDDADRPDRAPDVFIKCNRCKSECGLYKIE